MESDNLRKGQAFTHIIFIIVQVIFVLVVLGILVANIFPGLGTVFEEAETSRHVQQLVDDINSEVCGSSAAEGMLPPPSSPRTEYDFREVERFEADEDVFKVLSKGSDTAREVETGCEEITEIVVCKNEDKKQVASGCSSPGEDDSLSPGTYRFDYFLSNDGRLYLMVHREVEDDGPFIYYLSGETSNNELKAVSISERRIYEPRNMRSGATSSRSYTGGSISLSGDTDMDGLENNLVIGNQSYLFGYSMSDHSSESIKYDHPINIHDLGTIADIREGEVEFSEDNDCEPEWDTEENRINLARILWVESRNENVNSDSRVAIAYSVLRRMKRQGTDQVGGENGVISGYGHGESGQKHVYYDGTEKRWDGIDRSQYSSFLDIAEGVLTCSEEDVGKGATHYYSPRSMPKYDRDDSSSNDLYMTKEEVYNSFYDVYPDNCGVNDLSVAEITENIGSVPNFVPPWGNPTLNEHPICPANVLEPVQVVEANPWYFKFFRDPSYDDYTFYEKEFGSYGGNEILFINGTILEDERRICAYNYLDEKALDCVRDRLTCSAEDIGDVVEIDGEKKVLFANNTRKIYFWNGSEGAGDYGCDTESGLTFSRDVTGFGCGEYTDTEDCNVMEIGSSEDIDNDGDDEVVVVMSGRSQTGTGYSTMYTSLAYAEIPKGQEGFEVKEIISENNIVSLGEMFDGKIPVVVRESSGYVLKYYDSEEDEMVRIDEADKPRKVGGFTDILGE